MNYEAQWIVGITALNRSAKVRVKNTDGNIVTLKYNVFQNINIVDTFNYNQLSHHGSIGQYLILADGMDPRDGYGNPFSVLNSGLPDYQPIIPNNFNIDNITNNPIVSVGYVGGNAIYMYSFIRGQKVRVKGYRGVTQTYGLHTLKPFNLNTAADDYVKVHYGRDPNTGSSNDWHYNLRQLGKHSAIGQYFNFVTNFSVNLRAIPLNRFTGIRYFGYKATEIFLQGTPSINHIEMPSKISSFQNDGYEGFRTSNLIFDADYFDLPYDKRELLNPLFLNRHNSIKQALFIDSYS
jgi:hypothetical protein